MVLENLRPAFRQLPIGAHLFLGRRHDQSGDVHARLSIAVANNLPRCSVDHHPRGHGQVQAVCSAAHRNFHDGIADLGELWR